MADIIPHLAWPLRLAGTRLAQVEQDSLEDVRQNVHAYLTTPKGARPLSPDFGIEDPAFGPGLNAARLAADIMAAEDRATITVSVSGPDATGDQQVNVYLDLAQ